MTSDVSLSDDRRPSLLVSVGVVGVAILLIVGSRYLVSTDDGGHDHSTHGLVGIGDVVETDDALLRVTELRPEIMAQMRMPTGMMEDHVPEGYRRFTVEIDVMATNSAGFDPEPEMFTVSGEGLDPVLPHRAVADPEWMAEGNRSIVSLLFETPLDVEPVFLAIEGTDTEVQLEGDLGSGHNHDGDIGSNLVMRGYFEAEMADYTFVPDELIVEVGTEIAFHNHDVVIHNAAVVDGSQKTEDVGSDQLTEAIVFDEPGTYEIYCTIHPQMTMTINVVLP